HKRLGWVFVMGFFRKLFNKPAAQNAEPMSEEDRAFDQNPVVVASLLDLEDPDKPKGIAATYGEEGLQEEYEAFCADFCFKPGVRLYDFLKAEGVTHLLDWLDPKSP